MVMYVKNKLFWDLYYKIVPVGDQDLSLLGLFTCNSQGQGHATHLPNSRATALRMRPGLEDSKFQNIWEGDPVWGRGASPVFSEVQDTWQCLHRCSNTQTPVSQCKQLRHVLDASVILRHCSFLVFYLLIIHFIHTYVKERQMGKEEGLGISTAGILKGSDLLFSRVP